MSTKQIIEVNKVNKQDIVDVYIFGRPLLYTFNVLITFTKDKQEHLLLSYIPAIKTVWIFLIRKSYGH